MIPNRSCFLWEYGLYRSTHSALVPKLSLLLLGCLLPELNMRRFGFCPTHHTLDPTTNDLVDRCTVGGYCSLHCFVQAIPAIHQNSSHPIRLGRLFHSVAESANWEQVPFIICSPCVSWEQVVNLPLAVKGHSFATQMTVPRRLVPHMGFSIVLATESFLCHLATSS